MSEAGLGVASATLLLLALATFGRIAIRPRVGVYCPGGRTAVEYPRATQQTLTLHVKNRGGWLGLPSGHIDGIFLSGYFPAEFQLESGQYMGERETAVYDAPHDGRFQGMRYLTIGRFTLFKDEVEAVDFSFTTPALTGTYKMHAAITSEPGYGGIYPIRLTIK